MIIFNDCMVRRNHEALIPISILSPKFYKKHLLGMQKHSLYIAALKKYKINLINDWDHSLHSLVFINVVINKK